MSLFHCIASPAASKLAQRMTTLHEEPLIKQICYEEEGEDHFSEPDYPEYNDFYEQPMGKKPSLSKMKSSYTVESFIDIDKRSQSAGGEGMNSAGGKFASKTKAESASMGGISSAPVSGGSAGGPGAKYQTMTPSMSSSTSSGYGSQAVSCSNLTNDDTYSIRSMSVGETPGEWASDPEGSEDDLLMNGTFPMPSDTMSPSNKMQEQIMSTSSSTNAKSEEESVTSPTTSTTASEHTLMAESMDSYSSSPTTRAPLGEMPKRVNPFLKDANIEAFDDSSAQLDAAKDEQPQQQASEEDEGLGGEQSQSESTTTMSDSTQMVDESEESDHSSANTKHSSDGM